MVDAAFARFVINIEILEVVVEVHAARTQISAKQSSMGSKDGGDVDVAFAA